MEAIKLNVNQLGEWAPKLHAGDRVLLSGTVYTSRDAAHKRYFGLLDEGKPLPFDIKGAAIYYAGPTNWSLWTNYGGTDGSICTAFVGHGIKVYDWKRTAEQSGL